MIRTRINLLLVLSMLIGILSLPMKWFTLTDVFVDDSVFSGSVSALQGATLFAMPVWVLVAMALVASLFQLIDATNIGTIPAFLKWGLAIMAVIGLSLAIIFPVAVQGVTANVGAMLGFLSALIPTVALALGAQKKKHIVAE